jgi:hypothetical protein
VTVSLGERPKWKHDVRMELEETVFENVTKLGKRKVKWHPCEVTDFLADYFSFVDGPRKT